MHIAFTARTRPAQPLPERRRYYETRSPRPSKMPRQDGALMHARRKYSATVVDGLRPSFYIRRRAIRSARHTHADAGRTSRSFCCRMPPALYARSRRFIASSFTCAPHASPCWRIYHYFSFQGAAYDAAFIAAVSNSRGHAGIL